MLIGRCIATAVAVRHQTDQSRVVTQEKLETLRRSNKIPMFEIKAVPLTSRSARAKRPLADKTAPTKLRRLTATTLPKTSFGAPPRGLLSVAGMSFPCAIGRSAVKRRKREGDLASPAGRFRLLAGFFKPTCPRPAAPWPMRPIRRADGWCDDPQSPAYNRPLRLPSRYNYEELWRNDGLYDLVVVLNYNIWPRRRQSGSAIFLHCAGPDFTPTAGCIALRAADLRKLLPRLAQKAALTIW